MPPQQKPAILKIIARTPEGYQAVKVARIKYRSGKVAYRRYGEPVTLTLSEIQALFRQVKKR